MVTLGKKGSIHARRTAFATLRQKGAVKKLFDDIAQRSAERNGGYTRIVKLGRRKSDSAPMAFLEWVDAAVLVTEDKPDGEKKAKKKETKPKADEPKAEPVEAAETPAAKETPAEETPAPAPAEEPKPKKRRWFGRKSEGKK
jgi:large subunit ribosomal protein L17